MLKYIKVKVTLSVNKSSVYVVHSREDFVRKQVHFGQKLCD